MTALKSFDKFAAHSSNIAATAAAQAEKQASSLGKEKGKWDMFSVPRSVAGAKDEPNNLVPDKPSPGAVFSCGGAVQHVKCVRQM